MDGLPSRDEFHPLFHVLYGEACHLLPVPIVRLHNITSTRSWYGRATVTQGHSTPARLLCRVLSFPPTSTDVALKVEMEPIGNGEVWRRSFAAVRMTTRLTKHSPRTVAEHLPPVVTLSRMDVSKEGVDQVLVGLRIFGLPVPRMFWPKVNVQERANGEHYKFFMAIRFPWGAPLIRYEGWLDTLTPAIA